MSTHLQNLCHVRFLGYVLCLLMFNLPHCFNSGMCDLVSAFKFSRLLVNDINYGCQINYYTTSV